MTSTRRWWILILALGLFMPSCGSSSGGDGNTTQTGGCDGTPNPNPGVVDPMSLSFMVMGNQAIMTGVIDGTAPAKVQALIANNPAVTEIVLRDCPGSADDDSNIVAAKMVRAAGLNTRVEAGRFIASGAVDFFLAGVQRVADPASQVLVHTWVDGNGTLGRDLPMSDCAHALFIQYYTDIGLADPSGFYFFTLQFGNAPDGQPLHDMTAPERAMFGINAP